MDVLIYAVLLLILYSAVATFVWLWHWIFFVPKAEKLNALKYFIGWR